MTSDSPGEVFGGIWSRGVRDLAGAATGGVSGVVACAAAAVCVIHWGGSVDDVFFAVGVGEIRGPQGVEVDAGRLRERREGAVARGLSRE